MSDGEEEVTEKHTLNAIYIDTETGSDVKSRSEYIYTTIKTETPDGESTVIEQAQIKGRGNQSWSVKKKSYRLKLPYKQKLIKRANESNKDYILLASHADKSFLRNVFPYELANVFNGTEWGPCWEYVRVFLNGRYRGVYILIEKIEESKNKINLENDSESYSEVYKEHLGTEDFIDRGYIIELDNYAERDGAFMNEYYTVGNRRYTIQSEVVKRSEVKYLKSRTEECWNAVLSGDKERIEQLVDLNSVIDMYIINELMKNLDVGWSSFYMYFKSNGGKLYFGPPWDLDLSGGNTFRLEVPFGLYAGDAKVLKTGYKLNAHDWFMCLMGYDWFREMVKIRWNSEKDTIRNVFLYCCSYFKENEKDIEENFSRWKVLHTKVNQEPESVLALNSGYENVTYLFKWLRSRWTWMTKFFNSDDFVSIEPDKTP